LGRSYLTGRDGTADFVDGSPRACADYLEPLRGLRARDGVFAVMGNHEFIDRINPVGEWNDYYSKWGIPFLRASGVIVRPGLALGGVDDKVSKFKHEVASDVARAFASATNGEFRVLLQHRPLEPLVPVCPPVLTVARKRENAVSCQQYNKT